MCSLQASPRVERVDFSQHVVSLMQAPVTKGTKASVPGSSTPNQKSGSQGNLSNTSSTTPTMNTQVSTATPTEDPVAQAKYKSKLYTQVLNGWTTCSFCQHLHVSCCHACAMRNYCRLAVGRWTSHYDVNSRCIATNWRSEIALRSLVEQELGCHQNYTVHKHP
jgi:uncharacterized GH25 family protein